MHKIDAHSHVGYFGGWADVGYTDEQMVAEMDHGVRPGRFDGVIHRAKCTV